jgi:hypothetical protein
MIRIHDVDCDRRRLLIFDIPLPGLLQSRHQLIMTPHYLHMAGAESGE